MPAFKNLASCLALFFTTVAWGSADLDRQFALQTVGYLKSWDNVDGLFADYVDQAYREYFSEQVRYVLVDLGKANAVLAESKLPYSRLIEDAEILGQLARALKAESILRTRIQKEGPLYRFQIEWLHSPKMDLIATESFQIQEPKAGEKIGVSDIKKILKKGVDQVLGKIPFQGQVNGRDGDIVTVNLGKKAGVGRGDVLVIQTLDEVKKHPLLKSIVDWKLTPVGRAVIEDVDDSLGFAKIQEEAAGRQIARYQKITQVIPAPKATPTVEKVGTEPPKAIHDLPKFGWAGAILQVGAFTRQYSTSNGTSGFSGSGFFFGGKVDGNVWFTKSFFADVGFGFGFSTYGQTNLSTAAATTTGASDMTLFSYRGALGYTLFLTDDIFGPRGWAKLGFQSHNYSMLVDTASSTGSSSFSNIFLGLGADVPIRAGWGAQVSFDFGLINFVGHSTELAAGDASGPTSISFYIGGYYRLFPKMTLRAGMDFLAHSTGFAGGASLHQRVINFSPGLVYYF